MDQVGGRLRQHLPFGKSEQPAEGRIDLEHGPVEAQKRRADPGPLHRSAEERFVMQSLLVRSSPAAGTHAAG